MRNWLTPLLLVLCGLVLTAAVDPSRVGPMVKGGPGIGPGPAPGSSVGFRITSALGNVDAEWHFSANDSFRWIMPDSTIPYADIARLSVKILQPPIWDAENTADSDDTYRPRWIGYIDSVRAYNPKHIALTYAQVFGFLLTDSTSQNISGRWTRMIKNNNLEMRSITGVEVPQIPSFPSYGLINFMAPNCADSMATFIAEYWYRAHGADYDYTGIMLDYMDYDILDWECSSDNINAQDCSEWVDMDQDGDPYSIDPDEQAFLHAFWGDFCAKLREKMEELKGNDRFVLVANGSAPYYDDIAAANLDGLFMESIGVSPSFGTSFWSPSSPTTRAEALDGTFAARFSESPLRLPLLFMDMGRSRQGYLNADMSLALAMMIPGGISNGHTYTMNGRRTHFGWQHVDWDFGSPQALATQQGDTISRDYQNGYVRISMDGAWPYPYIGVITSGAEPDTVMRGGAWPREDGPADDLNLYLALQDSCVSGVVAYLRMSATSTDSFSIEGQVSLDGGATWPIAEGPNVSSGGFTHLSLYIAFEAAGCSNLNGTEYYLRYRTTDYTHGTDQTEWTVLGPFHYYSEAPPVDTTPPAAPSLYAIPADHYEHHLSWTAATEGDFSHYEVHRGEGLPNTIETTDLFADNITTNSFDFSYTPGTYGAVLDTMFTWQVLAVDTLGNKSGKSARRSAFPLDLVAPNAPIIESVIGGSGIATVYWNAPDDTSSLTYTVYRSSSAEYDAAYADIDSMELFSEQIITTQDSSPASDDSTYYYAVYATDVGGNVSPVSSIMSGTGYQIPSINSFAILGLNSEQNPEPGGDDIIQFYIDWTANKNVASKLRWWANNDAEPDTSAGEWSLSPWSDGSQELFNSDALWPTSDSDSTFTVSWNRSTPIPASGYRIDGQRNNGSWITLADTLVLGPTDSTLVVNASSGPGSLELRGKWLVRAYAVSGDALSDVAVADSALYNDAAEVHGKLKIWDGTTYVISAEESGIVINYSGMGADVTAPDTVGTFVAASIDTTDRTASTTGVIMRLTLDASEQVKSDFQWKPLHDGTWSAADDYDPLGATEIEYTDTIPTLMSTDDFFAAADTTGGAGIYLRYRLRDAALNVSPYVRITGDSNEALVFPRAAESSGDTVLYVFSRSSTMSTATDLGGGRWRFVAPSGDTLYPPRVVVVDQVEQYRARIDPQDSLTVSTATSTHRIVSSNDLPLVPSGATEASFLWYNCADSLSGITVIAAYNCIRIEAVGASAGTDIVSAGINTLGAAAWATDSDACYAYYDASASSAWSPHLGTYTSWSQFSAGKEDTTLAGATNTYDVLSIPVPLAAQSWANGDPNGGFWISGSAGTADTWGYYLHGTTTTAYRPTLWVLGVK